MTHVIIEKAATLLKMASGDTEDSHVKTIFKKLVNYRPLRVQRYAAVNVLLISWREDDTDSTTDAEQLGRLFKDSFNYITCSYFIPSTKPQTSLNFQVASFLDAFGGPDNLLIVYYAGHGGPRRANAKGPFTWAA